jgi:parallel beta-helix repeat protein
MNTRFRTISIVIILLATVLAAPTNFPPSAQAYTEVSTPVGTVVWGVLSLDKTWTASNSPYIIEGYVTVASGVSLSIEAGVTVKVNRSLYRGDLYVEGNLIVDGTENDPVVITSNKTTPAPDDYRNIWINGSAHLWMNWTEVWYAHVPIAISGDNNSVIESRFFSNDHPIYLNGAGNILDRIVVQSIGDSIQVYGRNNVIKSSYLSGGDRGIFLDTGSSGTTIINNTIRDKRLFGISIRPGDTGIVIHHNNFLNNTRHAQVGDNVAQFDDGYPSGGNYWSDYSGFDKCSGPNQDICPDPDGIGDTPYDVPHAVTGVPTDWDFYPLMCPTSGCPTVAPPRNLTADLSGSSFENVTLSWDLSEDDIGGQQSVVRYDILRGISYSSNSTGYLLHDSVANGTSAYVDVGAGEGDTSDYFYSVCAVDFNDNFTCSSGQAAKFTRPLIKGINLVSIPLEVSNHSVTSVLQTVSFGEAWIYNPLGKNWESFAGSKPYPGTLQLIDRPKGAWINVSGACNLTVAGIVPHNTSIQLISGWNLVGFPSFNSSYTAADLKSRTGSSRIEGYDPLSSPYYLRQVGDLEILEAGYGYWIWMDSDTTWIVKSS